jgi:hypothetical protein
MCGSASLAFHREYPVRRCAMESYCVPIVHLGASDAFPKKHTGMGRLTQRAVGLRRRELFRRQTLYVNIKRFSGFQDFHGQRVSDWLNCPQSGGRDFWQPVVGLSIWGGLQRNRSQNSVGWAHCQRLQSDLVCSSVSRCLSNSRCKVAGFTPVLQHLLQLWSGIQTG